MENYDKTSPQSIERYARQLLDKSMREFFSGDIEQKFQGKGKLGQLLEERFFQYPVNNRDEPDFVEAGVELKSTPMKRTKKGRWVSKERLVLNIINYDTEARTDFRHSSFWHKNRHLLLMFYLWEEGLVTIDYVFRLISLWRFPISDLKIIKDDWTTLHRKILAGKADEITEGDTLYMAACMKGSTKESSTCSQPFSNNKAQRRAYSLKNKYMNSVINALLMNMHEPEVDEEELNWVLDEWTSGMAGEPFDIYKAHAKDSHMEPVIKDIHQYATPTETFEEYVENRFKPYYGMSAEAIMDKLGIKVSNAKNRYALLTKAILGITKDKIEEFEKAGVTVKTIRLNKHGRMEQSMSFPAIRYKEIVDEEWEDSPWHDTLNSKFFFVVYQQGDGYFLKDAFFWNMPLADLREAERLWKDTREKIHHGDFSHFGKLSESRVCHVRPHGNDSQDLMEAPDGTWQKKYCFWLNAKYIKKVIDDRQLQRSLLAESNGHTILFGYVQSVDTLEWIRRKGFYNVRYGNMRGAVDVTPEMAGARYVVFHHGGKVASRVYRLDKAGPVVWSRETLLANGYPGQPHADEYLMFHLMEEEPRIDLSGLDMRRLRQYHPRFNAPFSMALPEVKAIL